MMHVLLLTCDWYPQPMGGLAVQLKSILEQLPQVQFTVLCPIATPLQLSHVRAFTVPSILSSSTIPIRDQENLAYVHAFWHLVYHQHLRPQEFQVIWSVEKHTAVAAQCLASTLNLPWVWTCALSLAACHYEEQVFEHRQPPVKYDPIEQQAWLKATCVTVNGSWWEAYFFPFRRQIFSIPNGIDVRRIDLISPAPKNELPGTRPWKLLYLGRLVSSKGLSYLLRPGTIPVHVDLLIVGTADSSQNVFQEIIRQGHEAKKWHYLGRVDDFTKKIRLIKSVDAVIMPSIHEPWGIVAMEAMACQTPLIYHAQTGISDFAHGWPLYLKSITPLERQKHIHDTIQQCLSTPLEEKRAKVQVAWQKMHEKQFHWSHIAQQYYNVFEQAQQKPYRNGQIELVL